MSTNIGRQCQGPHQGKALNSRLSGASVQRGGMRGEGHDDVVGGVDRLTEYLFATLALRFSAGPLLRLCLTGHALRTASASASPA